MAGMNYSGNKKRGRRFAFPFSNAAVCSNRRGWAWIAEDPATLRAACVGVAQHVKTSASGAAGATGRGLARSGVVEVIPHDHVFVGAHVSGIALAQGPAITVRRLDLDREAAAVNE